MPESSKKTSASLRQSSGGQSGGTDTRTLISDVSASLSSWERKWKSMQCTWKLIEAAEAVRYWVRNLHFCPYLGQFLTNFKYSFFPWKLMKALIWTNIVGLIAIFISFQRKKKNLKIGQKLTEIGEKCQLRTQYQTASAAPVLWYWNDRLLQKIITFRNF